jgi:hypothetical protein
MAGTMTTLRETARTRLVALKSAYPNLRMVEED